MEKIHFSHRISARMKANEVGVLPATKITESPSYQPTRNGEKARVTISFLLQALVMQNHFRLMTATAAMILDVTISLLHQDINRAFNN